MLEYIKAGQVITHPCAPILNIKFFFRPPSLPRSQPHHRHLPPLLKFLLNQRCLCNLVQGQGTPQSPPSPRYRTLYS